MARKFQIKRGLKANLPTLAQGEFAMTTDSGAEVLWLGTGSTNKKIPLNPTAADVGAMESKGWLSTYSTVLAAATLPSKAGYSFFAVTGGALVNAADAPFANAETQYFVYLDDGTGARRTVLAMRYGTGEVATRDIFSSSWLTDWVYCAPKSTVVLLDGSNAMTAALNFARGGSEYGAVSANSTNAYLSAYYPDNKPNRRLFKLKPKEIVSHIKNALVVTEYVNDAEEEYIVHHEGNKPGGSYTGNGSSARRTIDTGGIGNMLAVTSVNALALVTPAGAVQFNSTTSAVNYCPKTEINFADGVLTISTASFLNTNGGIYEYQVL